MIEIEYKFPVDDLKKIHNTIVSNGYKIAKDRRYEISIMYDNESGLMQKTNGRIRLRKSGDEAEFCYKKPISDKNIKKEIEYEVEVSDFDTLKKIISEMQFFESSSYERYRTEYRKGEVKVTIDEYPFGSYVEIEGEENKILEEAKDLGFDLSENQTEPCDTLFLKWRKAHGLGFKPHMRFEDYKSIES